jgi:carbonic anhydrase/acetyltransferase-like protein (isoleucine patch superfamily)
VSLAAKSSVWYNTVIRAERNAITIGENSSIGDHATITADQGPTSLGQGVTVGNGCTLTSCTVEDRASVQLGAGA